MKVIVATDRSETAQRAVAWAAQLAQRFGSLWKVPRYRPDPESLKQAGRATITELHPIAPTWKPVPPPRPLRPHKPAMWESPGDFTWRF